MEQLPAVLVLAVPDWRRQQRSDAVANHFGSAPALVAGHQLVERRRHGAAQLQAQYEKKYGPGNYVPDVFIQYWSMRVMAYLASLIALLALWGGWLLHRDTLARSKWFLRASVWAVITPFLMNTAGWMLTENGRQPWIVQGLMKTINANSPSVTSTDIWISLIVFVLIFIALGVIDLMLMLRYARRGLDAEEEAPSTGAGATAVPALTY